MADKDPGADKSLLSSLLQLTADRFDKVDDELGKIDQKVADLDKRMKERTAPIVAGPGESIFWGAKLSREGKWIARILGTCLALFGLWFWDQFTDLQVEVATLNKFAEVGERATASDLATLRELSARGFECVRKRFESRLAGIEAGTALAAADTETAEMAVRECYVEVGKVVADLRRP